MEPHDVVHTRYYSLDGEYGVECELTCACREHITGIGQDTRDAKRNADANHAEHRSRWLAWAVKNPELAEVAA